MMCKKPEKRPKLGIKVENGMKLKKKKKKKKSFIYQPPLIFSCAKFSVTLSQLAQYYLKKWHI